MCFENRETKLNQDMRKDFKGVKQNIEFQHKLFYICVSLKRFTILWFQLGPNKTFKTDLSSNNFTFTYISLTILDINILKAGFMMT